MGKALGSAAKTPGLQGRSQPACGLPCLPAGVFAGKETPCTQLGEASSYS